MLLLMQSYLSALSNLRHIRQRRRFTSCSGFSPTPPPPPAPLSFGMASLFSAFYGPQLSNSFLNPVSSMIFRSV